ncbi:MAG: hypothetical protein AAF192_08540, partial [Pseudomonadota bacterium]
MSNEGQGRTPPAEPAKDGPEDVLASIRRVAEEEQKAAASASARSAPAAEASASARAGAQGAGAAAAGPSSAA